MAKLTLEWSEVLQYTGSNVNIHAPLSAGVYRLSCKEGDKLPVFYVGQAENLYERLRDHLSDGEPYACIVRCLRCYTCYFRFAKVPRGKQIEIVQSELCMTITTPVVMTLLHRGSRVISISSDGSERTIDAERRGIIT